LLKNVLSAGGSAIITTNAKYAILNQFDRFHEDTPSDMCFTTTQCFVYNYGTNAPPTPLYRSAEASDWENNSTNFKAIYLYQRNEKTNNKWKAFPTESGRADFEKISSVTRKGIIEAYNNMKHEIAQIKAGSVRIVIGSLCAYNKTALRKLFKEQGFDVEATFLSNNKGHLSEDTSAAQLAGIMVKLDQ